MRLAHYTSWELDDSVFPMTCGTTWDESNYWKQKLIQEPDIQYNDLVERLCAIQPQLRELLTPLFDLVNHGKYASELLKELVFEGVRQEHFPTLPSRRRCIFLLPLEDHNSAIKRFGFSTERSTAVEISVDNAEDLFLADASLLNCNLLKHDELKKEAQRYWSGHQSGEPLLEYLYVGQFAIVGRLQPG